LRNLLCLKKSMILLQIKKQFLRAMCVHMAEKIVFQGVKKRGFSEQMKLRKRFSNKKLRGGNAMVDSIRSQPTTPSSAPIYFHDPEWMSDLHPLIKRVHDAAMSAFSWIITGLLLWNRNGAFIAGVCIGIMFPQWMHQQIHAISKVFATLLEQQAVIHLGLATIAATITWKKSTVIGAFALGGYYGVNFIYPKLVSPTNRRDAGVQYDENIAVAIDPASTVQSSSWKKYFQPILRELVEKVEFVVKNILPLVTFAFLVPDFENILLVGFLIGYGASAQMLKGVENIQYVWNRIRTEYHKLHQLFLAFLAGAVSWPVTSVYSVILLGSYWGAQCKQFFNTQSTQTEESDPPPSQAQPIPIPIPSQLQSQALEPLSSQLPNVPSAPNTSQQERTLSTSANTRTITISDQPVLEPIQPKTESRSPSPAMALGTPPESVDQPLGITNPSPSRFQPIGIPSIPHIGTFDKEAMTSSRILRPLPTRGRRAIST
jgi:hypothetical protein